MGRKATAEAPSNLAFVKYWGKRDAALRFPANNSISVNLSNAKTITSVEFDAGFDQDNLVVENSKDPPVLDYSTRVYKHLDRMRTLAGVDDRAMVKTRNTFPSGIGIASSASGFAALTVAGCAALDMDLSSKELSELARLASGSACRSIPGGFVEWIAEDKDKRSYAIQLAPANHWELNIVTIVVSSKTKKVSSTEGHALAPASPFFKSRLEVISKRLDTVRGAILNKDFQAFGQEIEMEAISFHTIAMTSPIQKENGWNSGAYYWLPESLELILAVQDWRRNGLDVYFTLDAGPTVHIVCLKDDLQRLISAIHEIEENQPGRNWDLLVNSPADGTRIIHD